MCAIQILLLTCLLTSKIGHFGDVSQANLLALVWKNTKSNTTKACIHQSKKCILQQTNTKKLKPSYRRVTNIRISAHFTHLRKFRNFVFATEVTIFSDHNPVMYLREYAPKSAKLTRWALGLQEFMHADSNIFHTSVSLSRLLRHPAWKRSGSILKGKDK